MPEHPATQPAAPAAQAHPGYPPERQRSAAPGHGAVLSVVSTYAAFAALWILLSDRAVGLLFTDHETMVRASTVKGWFFVAVTSLLLYVLVRRMAAALAAGHARELAMEREREQPPPMLVAIAEASTDSIFAKDEQGRYVLFNNAASRNVGKPVQQVLGRDDRDLFPPPQAQQMLAIHRRVLATGLSETSEEWVWTVNGERVFQTTRGPLRGAEGRIFGTYGIARDITEQKRAEQAQRLLADDISATLQALPDLLFELDAQGRYVKVKALRESELAAPPDQLLGSTVQDVLPADAAHTVMQALQAAGREGTDTGRTMQLVLDGQLHHFELSVARKPAVAGQGDRFIVLSRDITSRKAVEAELRQRNDELERFNHAAIEREVRMVALKREVNELAVAAGHPARYDVAFAECKPVARG